MIYLCLTRVSLRSISLSSNLLIIIIILEKKEWRQIKTNVAPAPRSEHAAIMIEGKDGPKMLIHGGLAAEGFLNEFFLFDLSKLMTCSYITFIRVNIS